MTVYTCFPCVILFTLGLGGISRYLYCHFFLRRQIDCVSSTWTTVASGGLQSANWDSSRMRADAGKILRALIQAMEFLHERASKKNLTQLFQRHLTTAQTDRRNALAMWPMIGIFVGVRFISLGIGNHLRLTRPLRIILITAYFLFERGAQSLDHLAKSAFP